MILFFGSGTGSSPAGCRRLCEAWDRQTSSGDKVAAARAGAAARDARCHGRRRACSGAPDLAGPALLEESPAVQRVVVASVPDSLRHSLQAGLLLDAQDIAPDHTVQPMFRDCVLGLWTERLLGGESSRPDDSPAAPGRLRALGRRGLPALPSGGHRQDRSHDRQTGESLPRLRAAQLRRMAARCA